jgi:hypothetical protein
MSRRKRSNGSRRKNERQHPREQGRVKNGTLFRGIVEWFVPQGELFAKDEFHGNIKWSAPCGLQLAWRLSEEVERISAGRDGSR